MATMGLIENPNLLASRQSFGNSAINLADPELELIDPTPNVHAMFVQFDKMFFWSRLASNTIVKWSKRMYSCAGTCSYDRALSNITLSEPLLKLRPRKDLVETLLHEMIHAYCFLTNTDRSRDGHGPAFQGHMHRINRAAGLNISIYHDFHDEVKLYQTHWWRCDGVCQKRGPYFGIVKRSTNRPPGPYDYWWTNHQATCGGTYIKIKEPEKKTGKKNKTDAKSNKTNSDTVKNVNDITKFVTVTTKTDNKPVTRPVLKDSNINSINSIPKVQTAIVFKGEGQTIGSGPRKSFIDAADAVRNAWANKTISSTPIPKASKTINSTPIPKKHKATDFTDSPPAKTRKIDDFFPKASAILKDLYGDDIKVSKKNDSILVSVAKSDLVDCPICNTKVSSREINTHIDECLNKDIIENLSTKTDIGNKFIKTEPSEVKPLIKTENPIKMEPTVKIEAGSSRDSEPTKCACCGNVVNNSMDEHLEECLTFFDTTIPEEGPSTSSTSDIIVVDDDDVLNESATFNATGTKYPCPCCFQMIEATEMNTHLDDCLC